MNESIKNALFSGFGMALGIFGTAVAGYTGIKVAEKILGPIEIKIQK